jgi:hypothetical protein
MQIISKELRVYRSFTAKSRTWLAQRFSTYIKRKDTGEVWFASLEVMVS